LAVPKASIAIAVLDAEGKLLSAAISKTQASAITEFGNGLSGAVQLTFAEGCHAQWLFDILTPMVSRLVVCNPSQNKLQLLLRSD